MCTFSGLQDKRTMLMGAVAEDNADTMQLLLAAGANVQLRNKVRQGSARHELSRSVKSFSLPV
jgi:ankyrin repeat protein